MNKDIAPKDDCNIKIVLDGLTDKFIMIRRGLLKEHTNRAGIELWEYKYWQVVMKDEPHYNITEPQECKRIVNAMNTPDVRFIGINNDYVNINEIKRFRQMKGYADKK